MLSVSAANRDGKVFDSPDRLDIRRNPNPHLAFGYGPHFCMGASLARDQLHIALGGLFHRVRGLRFAVPPDRLEPRSDHLIGGLVGLPVSW
jgi:cytochrome P450